MKGEKTKQQRTPRFCVTIIRKNKNAKKHRKQRKGETKQLSETVFEKKVGKRKTINISHEAGEQ